MLDKTSTSHLSVLPLPGFVTPAQTSNTSHKIKAFHQSFFQIQERDQHRQPSAGNQEAAAGQRESISGQRKGQKLLLAENIFLKSTINTLNIKLGGTFRHHRTRAVEVFIRKENVLLNSNNIPEVAERYIL